MELIDVYVGKKRKTLNSLNNTSTTCDNSNT